VITALLTFLDKKFSAISFILTSTIDDISSGWNFLNSPLYLTTIIGLSSVPVPDSTLNGHNFTSFYTIGSWNFRPISLLASNIVFTGFRAT
jgi:hypothetical protein